MKFNLWCWSLKWQFLNNVCPLYFSIRLKKNPMSQSCRAHLFSVRVWFSKIQGLKFFLACFIFFQFFMNLLVKIYKKRYDRHNETLWTTSLCQRLGFVLFTDKAVSAKHESSTEGVRNERFSASKVWFPVIQWLQIAFTGIIQIHGL